MGTRGDPFFDYSALTRWIDQGFALQEFILDPRGRAVDYRFLEVNAVPAGRGSRRKPWWAPPPVCRASAG